MRAKSRRFAESSKVSLTRANAATFRSCGYSLCEPNELVSGALFDVRQPCDHPWCRVLRLVQHFGRLVTIDADNRALAGVDELVAARFVRLASMEFIVCEIKP